MERIFIDIDRQDNSAQDAQKVASVAVKLIQKDKGLSDLIIYKIFILRTGSSFHILLMLKKNIDHNIYDRYFSYGPKKSESFITKRADEISKQT